MFLAARLGAADAALTPVSHPNHYIVVVDASFSTVRTPFRARAYRRLLQERLPEVLSSGGFGNIPPVAWDRDVFTVVTFGIVTDRIDYREAYKRLDEFSFRRDFIHPVTVRRRLSREQFIAMLWPRAFYRMTVLQWAKPAALASLPPATSGDIANRTFRIVISDGEPNDGVVQAEKETATTWGGPDVRAAQIWMDQATADVRATDATGREGESVLHRIDSNVEGRTETFFIDAQELIPRSADILLKDTDRLEPLDSFEFDYAESGGGITTLRVRAKPTRELKTWLAANGGTITNAVWQPRDGGVPAVPVSQTLGVPLPLGHDPCSSLKNWVAVAGQVRHDDRRLGRSLLNYRLAQAIVAPPAPICTSARLRRLLINGSIILAIVALIAYFLYERFIGSRPIVVVPGITSRVPLLWRAPAVRPFQPPREHGPAFVILLPPRWKQRLFCWGMTIRIEGDCAHAIRWDSPGNELRLPFGGDLAVSAFWSETPVKQCALQIASRGLGASAVVTIDYPTP